MITREFKLYLNAGVGVAPVINVNQFDQDEEWIFTLLQSDGTVYTPSTGAIIGLKQDGTTILNAGTVNSSGQVVITETEQMTAVPGSNLFEILIDGNSHGTANFVVFVERRPGDIDNPSESDISLFQEAIEAAGNVTQFQADISALQSGLATTNANLTSEANTRASADATLQSNISAEASTRSTQDAVLQAEIDQLIAPTGEAPSAAEVQNARIGVDGTTYDTLGNAIRGQVGDLKNALIPLNNDFIKKCEFTPISIGDVDTSYYVTVSPSGNIYFNNALADYGAFKVEVKPNTVYKIFSYAYQNMKYAITDKDNKLLQYDENTYSDNAFVPTVSAFITKQNAKWLYLPYHNIVADVKGSTARIRLLSHVVLEQSESRGSISLTAYINANSQTLGFYYPQSANGYTAKIYPVKKGESVFVHGFNIYQTPAFVLYGNDFTPLIVSNNLENKNTAELVDRVITASKDGLLILYQRDATGESVKFDIVTDTSVNGKKWDVIGDSFSASNTLAGKPNYVDFVKASLNLDTVNYGVGGTGYNNVHGTNAFYNVANRIRSDADIVTVFGSFNDLPTEDNPVLGTVNDTGTDTIAGCMANTFINIRAKAPDAMILCISPSPWQTNNNVTGKASWASINPWDYVDMLEKICRKYNVPYLDLYNHSNTAPWIASFVSKYQADGTHPNSLGHFKYIYPFAKHAIEKMF